MKTSNLQPQGAAKLTEYIWHSEPVLELDLSANLLTESDLNGLLRACYNHNNYPIREAGKGITFPLTIKIDKNPVAEQNRVPSLIESIKSQGGRDRVWFSNAVGEMGEDELILHNARLQNAYLVVHMPGAWVGEDDRAGVVGVHAAKRKRSRERPGGATSGTGAGREDAVLGEARRSRRVGIEGGRRFVEEEDHCGTKGTGLLGWFVMLLEQGLRKHTFVGMVFGSWRNFWS